MTRKDYELIADAFAGTKPSPRGYTPDQYKEVMDERAFIAHTLAAKFRCDNRNFDRDRFLRACGVVDA